MAAHSLSGTRRNRPIVRSSALRARSATAASFNGTSQLLRVTNAIPDTFTVAAWIKTMQDGG
jgi:hypothetical protein